MNNVLMCNANWKMFNKKSKKKFNKSAICNLKSAILCSLILLTFNYATCKYSTRDASPIPPEITTFRVNYLENKARYVNPALTPQVTEKLKQKL